MEIDDISQQKLKRAERSMRAKNSYRNKPFIKVERVKEIVDCLDEVVKSPVDFSSINFGGVSSTFIANTTIPQQESMKKAR